MKFDEYFSHQLVSGFHPFFFGGGGSTAVTKGIIFEVYRTWPESYSGAWKKNAPRSNVFGHLLLGSAKRIPKKAAARTILGTKTPH